LTIVHKRDLDFSLLQLNIRWSLDYEVINIINLTEIFQRTSLKMIDANQSNDNEEMKHDEDLSIEEEEKVSTQIHSKNVKFIFIFIKYR
jgi:hypothetical protein